MKIYKEEIFGPVLSIVRVKDYNEALELINNHQFGNGTSNTSSGEVARDFSQNTNIGMVYKCTNTCSYIFHTFGDEAISLWHGMHGLEGINCIQIKTVTSRW